MQPIMLKSDAITLRRIVDVVSDNGDPDALLLTAKNVCKDLLRNNLDLLPSSLEKSARMTCDFEATAAGGEE